MPLTPEEIEEEIQASNLRHRVTDDRLNNMEDLIKENTKVTTESAETLVEIKDILELGKTFFKIMKWIGIFFKWVSAVAGGVGVLYLLWKSK